MVCKIGRVMKFNIGIDIGGTFTDGVVIDEKNDVHLFKTPTVPHNPAIGLFNCVKKAAAYFGLAPDNFLGNVDKFAVGTTIATNALIQGNVASTGLITTKGFKDALLIAREGREYLPIDIHCERFPPLIPRRMIEEATERVDRYGQIVTPLNAAETEATVERLVAKGCESIAVSFLWSFQNPVHERRLLELIRKRHPEIFISISSDLAPILGEYERTATVVINSMLGPILKRNLEQLSNTLHKEGLKAPLLIMQSNGGLVPAEDASLRPVTLLNSGPVGGVVASRFLGRSLNYPNIIGVDMGGTSFDVSLITQGEFSSSIESRVNNHNIYVPTVDVYSIGAGGGSIAWVDMGRVLKVGPRSAGADPGPACYGRGGNEPTVTDADLVLGRLEPEYFLGGEMLLDMARAKSCIEKSIAQPLGLDLIRAAAGISQVVDGAMAEAVRLMTVRKGMDPRDYVLIAFGGAGPVHAVTIAQELGIKTIVVPYVATVQSAFGIAASDIIHSFARTELMGLDELERIQERYQEMESNGYALLQKEGIEANNQGTIRYADMRYLGQEHEITIAMPFRRLTKNDMEEIKKRFEDKYQSLYGSGTIFSKATIEVVTLRVDVVGATRKPILRRMERGGTDSSPAMIGHRPVFFPEAEEFLNIAVYDGERLAGGNLIDGPAIIQYRGTTTVLNPGYRAKVDDHRSLIITETANEL